MILGAVHVLRTLAAPVIAGLTCMKYAIIAPHIRSPSPSVGFAIDTQ